MTPKKLLNAIQSKWPKKIDFKISVTECGEFEPVWAIVKAYEGVDRKIDPHEEPWLDLANWCFNQSLTELARSNFLLGKSSVTCDEVSIEAFDKRVVEHLHEDSWRFLKDKYQC